MPTLKAIRAANFKFLNAFPTPPVAVIVGGALGQFLNSDATALMKNIDSVAKELPSRVPRINFLIMTPGYLSLGGRDETEEGIDKRMVLNYYARWKLTKELVPLLLKAQEAGDMSHLFSWVESID
ncbi:hypothetical protein C8J56DRAFT_1061539 [Mycena floridula]|nr:hypothetical protein C8J56DRAFT_1061539 [Mycena floridula]